MIGNFNTITLCGSTKFKDEFIKLQKALTLQGNFVFSLAVFGHSGDDEVWKDGIKEMLVAMHKEKIVLSDEILVVNVGGYIGDGTIDEVRYALSLGKKVTYLVEPEIPISL